jgi:hypothetical protein
MMEEQKSHSFNPYLLLVLIPGLLLTGYSGYTFSVSIYHLLFWERTSGVILEFKSDEKSDVDVCYVKIKFTPINQKELEVITDKSVGIEGMAINDEVTVFYNPDNPARFQPSFLMMSYFLVSLFFPFGLFLIYVGWPFEERRTRLLRHFKK